MYLDTNQTIAFIVGANEKRGPKPQTCQVFETWQVYSDTSKLETRQ
jgi:hypothetical protein